MRADDGVGAHRAVLDARQVHRAALALEEPAFAAHQFPEDAGHRGAARERMVMAAVGAEAVVVRPQGDREPGRDRLLAERQVARALD
jgi:hypothetical protein